MTNKEFLLDLISDLKDSLDDSKIKKGISFTINQNSFQLGRVFELELLIKNYTQLLEELD